MTAMVSLASKVRGAIITKHPFHCLSSVKRSIVSTHSIGSSRDSTQKSWHLKHSPTASLVGANRCLSVNRKSSLSKFPKKGAQKLIDDSRSFLEKSAMSQGQFHRQNAQLFNDWHHTLFTIPYTEVALLKESALCIDDLVHAFLHQHESQEMQDSGSQVIVDNAVDFVCTGIYAWGRVAPQDRDAPTKAEGLLTTLLGTFEKSGQNPSFRPSEDVYSALAYCWSQATNDDRSPERALNWLNIIIKKPTMTVSTATYNAVLRAYARQGRVQEVEQLAESIPAEKDVYTYEILVQAWLHSNLSEGPQKAYVALQEGIQNSLQNEDIIPLTQLFGRFLNTNKENPKMCQQVLNQAILLQQEHISLEILQARHFIITMTAWASKGEAEKVEQLFRTMEESHKNGNGRLKPTYQALCVVLSAFTKKKDLRYLQQAEGLLKLIEDLFISSSSEPVDNHAYNIILEFYSQTPGIDKKKERILAMMHRMEELSEVNQHPSLMPDKVSYASLIKAIIDEGKPNSSSEIEEIVRMMESSSRPSMQPDPKLYALALDGFSRSSNKTALLKGEELLDRLRERYTRGKSSVLPDVYMYVILMKIYSRAGDVRKSDSVLSRMVREYKEGNAGCRPNEVAYITAMGSWERSGRGDALDGALRLFSDMKKQYSEGNFECRPTVRTFGQIMVILAHSERRSKQNIGYKLLRSMKEFGVEADRVVLNWYLRVCASTSGNEQDRQDSLQSAFEVFESLRNSKMGTDSNSYISMLHACANLQDDLGERNVKISDVFSKCADDGHVNRKTLLTLRRFLTPERYQELTSLSPQSELDMKTVPRSWQRNTKSN